MTNEKEKKLSDLRLNVGYEVSEKRYRHILGVEECAVRIAALYSDILSEEDVYLLRAAALLHDVTKDKGDEWQRNFISENKIILPKGDEEAVQLWHSFTAPTYVSLRYPEFSCRTVLDAVYRHATGDVQMTLTDKIVCLADYIENGRKYDACIDVRRRFFFDGVEKMSIAERIKYLDRCLLLSFKYISEHLSENGEKISNKTKRAMDALISEINSTEEL